MGTVKELLAIAERQVGVKENPPNSNNVRYNTWYYDHEVNGKAYPWCMVFCQWVYDQAHVALPIRTASCTTMMTTAKKVGRFVTKDYSPGDLILYDFDGVKTTSDHCGILKTINGIKMETIEGNTGNGNDVDGGAVMLRSRKVSQVIGAYRPIFDREEDVDMTKTEFMKSLTDEEAYILLEKAMAYANKQKEPSWSKKEGHWAKAMSSKVVTSDTPEGIVKRDELIAIMGRLGLIK